ncbi:MAG: S-layer homology domain-containing protein [Clostridia bacterium]|nr:S-layer homology domain-containing protein [Clostridia bacterium]
MKKIISALLTVVILVGSLSVAASSAGELPFKDVSEKKWFYSCVKYVYENGIMGGVSDDVFDPNGKMTRAMFVTILCRLDGGEEKITNAFKDVKSNAWYAGYVGWAEENGVFGGYEDGTFKPNAYITREQSATAIIRYIEYAKVNPLKSSSAPSVFKDNGKIASWAKSYVDEMRMYGIVAGDNNGNFNPKGTLTRAEAATIIQRMKEMFDYLKLEDPITPDYKVDGKDFYLLNPYDLYYGGPVLSTSYNATEVVEEDGRLLLAGKDDGRKITDFYCNPANTAASGNYFGIDLKVACIDPAEYPHVVIGYVSDSDASIGVYSVNISTPHVDTEASSDGTVKVMSADLSGKNLFDDESEQITLTVKSESDIKLAYVALFKDMAALESFSSSDYADELTSFEGEPFFYEKMDEKTLNGYMNEAENKKAEIMNAADVDPSTVTGTCYYISSVHGNDANDGLSPDKPWKSLSKLYTLKKGAGIKVPNVKAGDAVFFERGSLFYAAEETNNSGNHCFDAQSGVTYAAYGKGDKPVFTTRIDFGTSKTGHWTATDAADVYVLDYDLKVPEGKGAEYNDIGEIVFNGGELWGIKVIMSNYGRNLPEKTGSLGYVTNGRDVIHETQRTSEGYASLVNDLEFWLDTVEGKLYLCCKDGNPEKVFDEIMVTKRGSAICGDVRNVTFDDLAVIGAADHGFDLGNVTNVKIQNCVMEWIGGDEMGGRLGNAVQNWGSCDGFFVVDNYINQVYDTGITTQGAGIMINCDFSGNVIDRCNMSIELFNGPTDVCDAYCENIITRDNYIRYSGYSFGHTRGNGNKTGTFFLGSKGWGVPIYNMVFENNVCLYGTFFSVATSNLACGEHAPGVIFRNNVYLMNPERGYASRSQNNIIDWTGSPKTFLPYTEQYVQYLTDMGVNRGTKYYTYDGYLFDEEKEGTYYDLGQIGYDNSFR